MTKSELRAKIEESRFLPITDETFDLLDAYERVCRADTDDFLRLQFYRGEAEYRLGNYDEALKELSKAHVSFQPDTDRELMIDICNVLGLIHTALDMETMAIGFYLQALETANRYHNLRKKIIVNINIGTLYKDMGDYETAGKYYEECLRDAEHYSGDNAYNLVHMSLAYLGVDYFMAGDSHKGLEMFRRLEKDFTPKSDQIYDVVSSHLLLRGYYYLEQEEKFEERRKMLLDSLQTMDDFLEMSEVYFDVCRFVITVDEQAALEVLTAVSDACSRMGLPSTTMKMKWIELEFSEKYESENVYRRKCREYVSMRRKNESFERKSRLDNIESEVRLSEVRRERNNYFERSRRDLMTGLLNKMTFTELAATTIRECTNPEDNLVLAVIDVDKFKTINDTYGHDFGDKVIRTFGGIMSREFSLVECKGRLGGDEFGILWTEVRDEDKEEIKHRLESLHTMLQMELWDEKEARITISIGVAVGHMGITYEELFRAADEQLYTTKNNGRDNTFWCEIDRE